MSAKKVTVNITSTDTETRIFDGWYSDAGTTKKLSSKKEYQFSIINGETKNLYIKYTWAPVTFILKHCGKPWSLKIDKHTVTCRADLDTTYTVSNIPLQDPYLPLDRDASAGEGPDSGWPSRVVIEGVGEYALPFSFIAKAGRTYKITPKFAEGTTTTTTTTSSYPPPFSKATLNIHNTDPYYEVDVVVTPEGGTGKKTKILKNETASIVIN